MSVPSTSKELLSRQLTASTSPSLNEVDEIIYSKNQQQNGDDEGEQSGSTSKVFNPKEYESVVTKKLTYDIFQTYSQINPLFIFDRNNDAGMKAVSPKPIHIDLKKEYDNNEGSVTSSVRRKKSIGVQYRVPSNSEIYSYHYSRSNSVCNVKMSIIPPRVNALSHTGLSHKEKKNHAEKMTYCRPVTNNCYYNEEFVFKTTERDKRLQKLVKMMAVARERERQENVWNNYINELKRKHRFNTSSSYIQIPHEFDQRVHPELIEDFYRTNFKCQRSNLCKSLLKDLYEPCTSTQTNFYDYLNAEAYRIPKNSFYGKYSTQSYPVPSDSPLILNRDRSNQCGSHYDHYKLKDVYDSAIFLDRQCCPSGAISKNTTNRSTVVYKRKPSHLLKDSCIQTHLKLLPIKDKRQESAEDVVNVYDKVALNISKIKNHVDDAKNDQRRDSLKSIESKLDVLIKSVNTLIEEIRAKPQSTNSSLTNNNRRITISRSIDAVTMPTDLTFPNLETSSSKMTFGYKLPTIYQNVGPSKIDSIIVEEINKSNEAKRDIENILNGDIKKTCAVQIITDYIPTREHSTEVTDSLSKTKVNSVEEVKRNCSEDGRITIAVNTDPLGLLALLRISKEAVKNVISYMQNFPYQYLLQLPSLRENGTSFTCNVCGAVFMTPTQLSEHIHGHVRNRDCCVCRHLTGLQAPNPRRIFFCEYCGKPFNRAYCCELHQQTCAKRLGRLHDVTSSLVLLR